MGFLAVMPRVVHRAAIAKAGSCAALRDLRPGPNGDHHAGMAPR